VPYPAVRLDAAGRTFTSEIPAGLKRLITQMYFLMSRSIAATGAAQRALRPDLLIDKAVPSEMDAVPRAKFRYRAVRG